MKIQKLRIPFQGSKQLIAEKLLIEMLKYKPKAKYFVDLFGGGGSMSFMALQMGFDGFLILLCFIRKSLYSY